ncbi:MAG: RDD family protein, partial [Spirochaetales bacterium]|nr:RDD family protein [Spirochaetales bacterium]
ELYGVDFDSILNQADYDAMSDSQRANYDAAVDAMNNDPEIMRALNVIVRMIIAIVSISVFLAFMVIEFIIPLIMKNGQTVGKKIFGLAVMRVNGVRIRTVSLFIRTFLGKYVIETMIPVLIALMIIFNAIGIMGGPGIMGLIFVGLLLIGQVLLLCFTKTKSMIHDIISDCVVVDMASQLIFDDEQSMLQYKAQKSAEIAAKSPY